MRDYFIILLAFMVICSIFGLLAIIQMHLDEECIDSGGRVIADMNGVFNECLERWN